MVRLPNHGVSSNSTVLLFYYLLIVPLTMESSNNNAFTPRPASSILTTGSEDPQNPELGETHAETGTTGTTGTWHFAYNENMDPKLMQRRYPGTKLVRIGRLLGFKWIIDRSGHPNIFRVHTEHRPSHEVWGMVYEIDRPEQLAQLDSNECHELQKSVFQIQVWRPRDYHQHGAPDTHNVLVYAN